MEENKVIIDTVIDLLIDINCDGETMQFILEKVGIEYQMLRQLMMTMPIEQVEYLLAERNGVRLNNQKNKVNKRLGSYNNKPYI